MRFTLKALRGFRIFIEKKLFKISLIEYAIVNASSGSIQMRMIINKNLDLLWIPYLIQIFDVINYVVRRASRNLSLLIFSLFAFLYPDSPFKKSEAKFEH